jgi:site-specific DNA-methyltransferase (adenine-specific)
MLETNKIYNQDCLVGMRDISDKSVDMILCDLPYGTTLCKWDNIIPFALLWEQYLRVIKDNGAIVLTAQQPFATDLINSCRKYFRYEIIWEKTQKLGFLNANKMPLRGHENILVFYKRLPTYNPQKYTAKDKKSVGRVRSNDGSRAQHYSNYKSYSYKDSGKRHPHSVIRISNWNGALFGRKDKEHIHPTQKPVELFSWLIKTYSNVGDLVLDNCMGSGTTAIACIENDRKFIGFETEKSYFELSVDRIANKMKTL